MRLVRTLLCLLAATGAGFSQNGSTITFGAPTYTPKTSPQCGNGASTFTQNASYPWTLYCENSGDFTSIRGGNVQVTGTGTCGGTIPPTYCKVDVPYNQTVSSPGFYPGNQTNQAGTAYQMWVNAVSVNGVGANGGCNTPSTTQGDIVTTTIPTCGRQGGCVAGKLTGISSESCGGCPPGCSANNGYCYCCPIVLDVTGQGFKLTDIEHGVYFRWKADGPKFAMSWTDPVGQNGWLTLPDHNGQVLDAGNLFSAVTPQPKTDNPNGYVALAIYDLASEGGNNNGWIDPGDSIYAKLRVWVDGNQNGEAEPEELHTLEELGIRRIGLRYHLAEKIDQYGNIFRYVSQVLDESDPKAYDVWLKLEPKQDSYQ